jgi:hypothetical protein
VITIRRTDGTFLAAFKTSSVTLTAGSIRSRLKFCVCCLRLAPRVIYVTEKESNYLCRWERRGNVDNAVCAIENTIEGSIRSQVRYRNELQVFMVRLD